MIPSPIPSLRDLRFNAKIDYVTLNGTHRIALPRLSGKARWPKSCHGSRLTVHDPSSSDIRLLGALFPKASLYELEVAVDLRLAKYVDVCRDAQALAAVKREYVAKGLKPSFPVGLNGGFRGCYQKTTDGYRLWPFSLRLPNAAEQHLHGRRTDGAQVKVYLKTHDHKIALRPDQHRVRVEVRLGPAGLDFHHLIAPADLFGFRYRKALMPYFQHVRSTSRKTTAGAREANPMLGVLVSRQEADDAMHWQRVGVGTFEPGGKRADQVRKVRFHKSQDMNGRIGQALQRLQADFAT